ncbi:hypothetical protein BDV93DRAFT_219486 [Ceratobasidium sp. AG-I]|nr:hypothetical protein BDV93DRAFT_219486 [Ceratobasidium sp. AG-I]
MVGRVYERLRQTCSPSYQVGDMGPTPPGDTCKDVVSACCCNSIAFALAMLCLNCQYANGTTWGHDGATDAAAGRYGQYLNSCGPVTNQSLPNTTQTAVCNQGIKIPSYLYTLFWGNGPTMNWFYELTRQNAQLQIQSRQNETTFCNTTTPENPHSDSEPNIGAIVGGAVGGAGLLAIAALAWFFNKRYKRRGGVVDLGDGNGSNDMIFEPFPILPMPSTQQSGPSSSGRAYADASSDAVSNSGYIPARPYKSGVIASYPPNRNEAQEAHSLLGPDTTDHSNERHEDSEALSSAFGLTRSASGRLPPSYQQH